MGFIPCLNGPLTPVSNQLFKLSCLIDSSGWDQAEIYRLTPNHCKTCNAALNRWIARKKNYWKWTIFEEFFGRIMLHHSCSIVSSIFANLNLKLATGMRCNVASSTVSSGLHSYTWKISNVIGNLDGPSNPHHLWISRILKMPKSWSLSFQFNPRRDNKRIT